ncbi:hypothetical protein OSB04_004357 [Centaurea solstitialis]|uniref:MYB transcription factor n=1 Tax=Centaurea solstitialis TaxID=347529 RepID=A0AA38U728_9ASTR|nr:hypothetical protein OSB04_004357 [Centaurea solstitialis]
MAKQKQKWTSEEEFALCAGVEKHGQGKWKVILSDPEFASSLANRSNIDLKDKWRNLGVSGGMSSSREKVRTPKLLGVAINSIMSPPEPLSAVPLLEYDSTAEPSRSSLDRRTVPEYVLFMLLALYVCISKFLLFMLSFTRYDAMIYEALFNLDHPNGPDANKIMDYIEQRFEVPQNFRRSVTSKLRRLVLTGELEKVDNCYKFKDASFGAEPSQPEDVRVDNNPANRNEKQKAPGSSPTRVATENDAPEEDSPTPLAIENAPEDSPAPLAIENNAPEGSPAPPAATQNNAPVGSVAPRVATENNAAEGSVPPPPVPTETLEDATLYAVYAVAVAESTAQEAAAAGEKVDRLAAALEESTARLMLIQELHERFK